MHLVILVMAFQAAWALLAGPALAVPSNQKVWTFTQPDGTKFKAVLRGDEFHAYHQTPEGLIVVQDPKSGVWHHALPRADGSLQVTAYVAGKSAVKTTVLNKEMVPWLKAVEKIADAKAQQMTAEFGKRERAPASGALKGVILLANFSDTSTTYDQGVFTSLFNQTGYNANGANGSVKDYYLEASYGKLTVQTDVYGWFNLPQTKAFYGANVGGSPGNDANPRQMIMDAINASNATVNYANYDSDGDGWVDFFGVIHQGQGEEQGGAAADCIWSHRWSLASAMTVDGKTIQDYHTEPEMFYSTLTTIGVICHEMGHVFGLPDLYDTDYSSSGVGEWSIMASGSWAGPGGDGSKPVHFDPWCKMAMGWLTPTVVTSPMTGAALPAFDQNAKALLIPVDPYQDGEYFLVANRYARATASPATGFEQYVPGSGALILHVDDYIGDNDTEARKKVDVEEADGLDQLDHGFSEGDSGDVYKDDSFSGFDDTAHPDSKDNAGASTAISVSGFTGAGTALMTCDITPRPVLAGLALAYDNNGSDSYSGTSGNYGCVRFTTATGGTLKRVKTYFRSSGTTNYTVTVYSGWSGSAPTGLLATQSGSHAGTGDEEITLATQPVFAAGADFYVVVRYVTGISGPIPVSIDGVPDLRSWKSANGVSFTQVTPASGDVYDICIRADLTPPATGNVVSITRPGTSPSKAATVSFLVNFNQAVLGGDASNFALAVSGLTGCSIAGVTGNGSTRTVTVNTGSGAGTVGLNMPNVTGMTDAFGRAITGAPLSGAAAYTVDHIIPVLNTVDPTQGSAVNTLTSLQVTFNKAVTGVSAGLLKVNGVAATTLSGSGAGAYTFGGFTPPAYGSVSVALAAGSIKDSVGNAFAGDSWTLTRLAVNPQVTLTSADVASGGIINKAVAFSAAFDRAVTGFAAGDITVSNGSVSGFSGSGKTYAFTVTPTANGAVSVSIPAGAVNDATAPNNPNDPLIAYLFTFDNVAPTGTVTINNGDAYTRTAAVTLKPAATDGGSGLGKMRFSNDGVWDTEAWENFATSKAWTLAPGEGSKTVYAQYRDAAGNTTSAVIGDAITIDSLAPASQVTAPTNNSYLTTATITLKWTASDSGAAGVQSVDVYYKKDNGTTAKVSGSPFAAAATSTTFKGSGYGVYQFYSIARDKAGNVEQSAGFDVRVRAMSKSAVRSPWALYE